MHQLKEQRQRLYCFQKLTKLVKELNKFLPVCICGDFNIRYQDVLKEKDIFQAEDIRYITNILKLGFIDALDLLDKRSRNLHLETILKNGKEVKASLDYFLLSKDLAKLVKDVTIKYDIEGSNHSLVEVGVRNITIIYVFIRKKRKTKDKMEKKEKIYRKRENN